MAADLGQVLSHVGGTSLTGDSGDHAGRLRESVTVAISEFRDDEPGYLAWLVHNPTGFVLNCQRQPNAGYLALHRATCRFVTGTPPRGRRWTAHYIKVTGAMVVELAAWARATVGGTPTACRFCRP